MEEKREKSTPQKKQTDSSVSREKQSLWIIKNYLNLPQHTLLDTDSAPKRLQCETRACASIGGTKQAAWLTLANNELKSKNTQH